MVPSRTLLPPTARSCLKFEGNGGRGHLGSPGKAGGPFFLPLVQAQQEVMLATGGKDPVTG